MCWFLFFSAPVAKEDTSNKFINDGSFLQQFLKMQKEKSATGSEPCQKYHALKVV